MRPVALALGALLAAPLPAAAQQYTGEVRLLAAGGYAPRVGFVGEYNEIIGPPGRAVLGGLTGDLSFRTGRFRLGPEAIILRGAERRVWGLGGAARYEFGTGRVRPYGVLGGAALFWEREVLVELPPEYGSSYRSWSSDVDYFTVGGGAGVAVGPAGGRLAFTAELRGHTSLQHGGGAGTRNLVTLAIGGRAAW